jgi:maltose-binding protein MalE
MCLSHSAVECVFQGSYAGNAAGFKLNTLPKLLDTRANKPRMTFLHFVVQVAETTNKAALAFIKDLSNITNICKYVSTCMSYL